MDIITYNVGKRLDTLITALELMLEHNAAILLIQDIPALSEPQWDCITRGLKTISNTNRNIATLVREDIIINKVHYQDAQNNNSTALITTLGVSVELANGPKEQNKMTIFNIYIRPKAQPSELTNKLNRIIDDAKKKLWTI